MTLPSRASLDRRLGPLDASAIVISNVIGVGIFTTPGVVAAMLPSSTAMLGGVGCWAACARVCRARWPTPSWPRGGRRPAASHVYMRESFGRLAAFLTGWTSFVAGFSGAIAFGSVAVAGYLDRFIPGAGDATDDRRLARSVPFGLDHLERARSWRSRSSSSLALRAGARRADRAAVVQNSLDHRHRRCALVAFVVAGIDRGAVAAGGALVTTTAPPANGWLIAHGAGDVQLHRLERRGLRRRGSAEPDAQRAAGAGARDRPASSRCTRVERALPPRRAARRAAAARSPSARSRPAACSDRRPAAMFAGLAILIILSSLSAWTLGRARASISRWRATACSSAAAARVHPRYRTPAIAIRRADGVERAARAVGHVRAAADLHRLLGDPVLGAGGALAVLRADPRQGHRHVPRVGLSVGAGDFLRSSSFAIVINTIVNAPGAAMRRPRRDGGRRADLLVDGKEKVRGPLGSARLA